MRFWLVLCVALFLAGCSSHRALPGDLVFFKTGSGESGLHVGIYDTDNQFIHASTSQGVTRSSLDNVYWHKNFWQARRI